MFAYPTGFQAELEAAGLRPVTAYEVTLKDATVIRMSDQAFTWDGNAYTAEAVRCSPIVETMESNRQPEATLTVTNIDNALRAYIEPTEQITGARLLIRLLLRDNTETLLAGSLVMFHGELERPRRVNEKTFELKAVALGFSRTVRIPPRRTHSWCPWIFKDAVNCNYVKTTDADGPGTDSTALTVLDGTNLNDGDSIAIGAGAAVLIASGGGTVNIVLAEARSWSGSNDVVLQNCSREWPNCQQREREHEYGGFRGIEGLRGRDIILQNFDNLGIPASEIGGLNRVPFINEILDSVRAAQALLPGYANSRTPVPLLYGRRAVPGKLIEETPKKWAASGSPDMTTQFRLISEGPIDSVVGWLVDGEDQTDLYGPVSGLKWFGMYYRPGAIGVDDTETEAEYVADPTTVERAQNTDYLSFVAAHYSRSAYGTFMQSAEEDFDQVSGVLLDTKGIEIQKYTNGSTPTTDGAIAWSRNPIWQTVDQFISDRRGQGVNIADTDLDFTVIKGEADHCDTAVTGKVATVVSVDGSDASLYTVDDTSDFVRGMPVEYDGGIYSNEADEVVRVISPTEIQLGTARASGAASHTITSKAPRFSSDVYLEDDRDAPSALTEILRACRGYITYSDEGEIQIRVERTGSSVATFADTGAAAGYDIVDGSFEWLRSDFDPTVNRVYVNYVDPNNERLEHAETDWDHIASGYPLNSVEITVKAIDNREAAARIGKTLLGKHRTLNAGARFMVGPAGLVLQPGDIVSVTHAVPNWTAQDKRITKIERIGLGSQNEYMVRLTVVDYDATIYDDYVPPTRIGVGYTAPVLTLTAEATGGRVRLAIGVVGNPPISLFSFYKSSSSWAGSPPSSSEQIGRTSHRRSMVYDPTDAEIETTIYFMASALIPGPRRRVYSAEISVVATWADPADGSISENLVYDGDFRFSQFWTLTDGGEALVDPTINGTSADDDVDFTTPANAYNTETTSANGAITDAQTPGHLYDWASATKRGSVRVVIAQDGGTKYRGACNCYWSLTGAAPWTLFASHTRTQKSTQYSEDLGSIDLANLTVRVNGTAPAGVAVYAGTAKAYAIQFAEVTAPYGTMGNGILTLISDGVTAASATSQSFPGRNPQPGAVVFESGSDNTVQIALQRGEAGDALDAVVNVKLYDQDTDTTFTLLTVAAADVTATGTNWNHFSALFQPGSAVGGQLEVIVDTMSTKEVRCDKIGIHRNAGIPFQFVPSVEEQLQGFYGDDSQPRRNRFPRGVQTAGPTNYKTTGTS